MNLLVIILLAFCCFTGKVSSVSVYIYECIVCFILYMSAWVIVSTLYFDVICKYTLDVVSKTFFLCLLFTLQIDLKMENQQQSSTHPPGFKLYSVFCSQSVQSIQ